MSLAINFIKGEPYPLTSYLAEPKSHDARDEGVLIVPSGPWDAMRLAWVTRQASEHLVRSGFHVLRFDLTGTGDSAAPTEAAAWDTWQQDTRIARDFLRQKVRKVHVLGFRLGAALALLSSEDYGYRSMHVVDPVLSGKHLRRELAHIQEEFLVEQNRFGAKLKAPDEIFGFPLGAVWEESFASYESQSVRSKCRRFFIYESEPQSELKNFCARLEAQDLEVARHELLESFAWRDPTRLHMQYFAHASIKAITQAFTEL